MKIALTELNKLRNWFLGIRRSLPWRENHTPYAVWVSEVMLQQTQVAVVVPYFERWMLRFPSIKALAEADIDEVIKQWEGLGYYSRARNLHQGARYVMGNFKGELPKTVDELSQIKGLGPYTIGAIRSFAFHQRAAAVDGNVLRVLARYFQIEEEIDRPRTINQMRAIAEDLLPNIEPWVISEALIELGAVVCGRQPNCQICPLKGSCQGYLAGKAAELPKRSPRKMTEHLFRAVGVFICDGHILLKRCESGQIMSGLHEFPYFEIASKASDKHVDEAITNFYPEAVLKCRLKDVKHTFTHHRVLLKPAVYHVTKRFDAAGYQWLSMNCLSQLAFSSGHRRLLQQVLDGVD